ATQKIEEHLADGCAACRQEVKEIQTALTLLPESLPTQEFRKNEILNRIHQSIPPESFDAIVDYDAIAWEDIGLPGVKIHWLRKDKTTGSTVSLLRVQAGFVFSDHRHIGSEDCFVLQGGFQDNRGTYHAGQYVHYEPGYVQKNL